METATREEAQQTAGEFMARVRPRLGLSVEQLVAAFDEADEDLDPNVGPLWEFSGRYGTVGVSGTSGAVVSFASTEPAGTSDPSLSQEQAMERVRAFLGAEFPAFEEARFELTESELSEGQYRFGFEQRRTADEVSIFHNFVAVSLSADQGRITSYDRSDHSFVRTAPPAFPRAAAQRKVEALIGGDGEVVGVELFEQPIGDYTRAVTVWGVSVESRVGGFESLDMILIDADSGERVDLDD